MKCQSNISRERVAIKPAAAFLNSFLPERVETFVEMVIAVDADTNQDGGVGFPLNIESLRRINPPKGILTILAMGIFFVDNTLSINPR